MIDVYLRHFGFKCAVGQTCPNRLPAAVSAAERNSLPSAAVDESVTARQHGERRESLKADRSPIQALLTQIDDLARSTVQTLICALQAAMDGGDASGDILKTKTVDENRKQPRANAKGRTHGGIQAEAQLIETLVRGG